VHPPVDSLNQLEAYELRATDARNASSPDYVLLKDDVVFLI